MHLKYIKKL